MLSLDRSNWFSSLVYDALSRSASVTGYTSAWKAIGGPPRSRLRWAMIAARLPPAESPPTMIGTSAPAISVTWELTHSSAA